MRRMSGICRLSKPPIPARARIFRPPGGKNAPPYLATVGNLAGLQSVYARIDDFYAYSGGTKPPDDATIPPDPRFFPDGQNGYWLKLEVDPANPDTYQAEWQTPRGFASDMILDVILYDNAVYPFDPAAAPQATGKSTTTSGALPPAGSRRKASASMSTITIRARSSSTPSLDWATSRNLSNAANLSFEGNPTESWMTEFDPTMFPTTARSGNHDP